MAKQVLSNAFLSIAAVDLSDHVESVTLTYEAEAPESTSMGDTTRTRLAGGLLDWNLAVTFRQDYAASEVDVTLFALVGTDVAIVLRPDTGVVSATNPQYTGQAILTSYAPVAGSVGETQNAEVALAGNGVLARAVA